MLSAFHSQIVLHLIILAVSCGMEQSMTYSVFTQRAFLAFHGLVSQTITALLSIDIFNNASTSLRHQLPLKSDSSSFLTWLIGLLKTQLFILFNLLSLHSLCRRLPFALQLNSRALFTTAHYHAAFHSGFNPSSHAGLLFAQL